MNKYFLFLLVCLIIQACEKESVDPVFSETPEARTAETLAGLQDCLVSATEGWIGILRYNNSRSSAIFHLFFHQDGTAKVVFKQQGENITNQTTYTLTYTQTVSMVFDSYSIFAEFIDLGNNAAFRFELEEAGENRMVWKARNELSTGSLTMVAGNSGSYERMCKMEEQTRGSIDKSFWRVMTLEGSDRLYSFYYTLDAVFEWREGETVKGASFNADINEKGFTLKGVFETEGIKVKRFEYQEDEDCFVVYDTDGNKVGRLAYALEKPFDYPGSVEGFMNSNGAKPSTLIITPFGYSMILMDQLKRLQNYWGSEVLLMGFQRKGDVFGMLLKNGEMKQVLVETTLGDSYVDFQWLKTADNCYDAEKDPGAVKFLEAARPFLENFGHKRAGSEEIVRWDVVPRDGSYIFVQSKNPKISFLAKAMTNL